MCLTLTNTNPIIAIEDIICYKFLVGNKKALKTAFQNSPVNIGETYESKLENKRNLVSRGLHSFVTLEGIKIGKQIFSWKFVAECVIPKGAQYYVGEFFDQPSYASNKLTYVKLKYVEIV